MRLKEVSMLKNKKKLKQSKAIKDIKTFEDLTTFPVKYLNMTKKDARLDSAWSREGSIIYKYKNIDGIDCLRMRHCLIKFPQ